MKHPTTHKVRSKLFLSSEKIDRNKGSRPKSDKDLDKLITPNLGNGKCSPMLTIISWNVGGLRSLLNKNNITELLQKYKPDILCFNETKVDKDLFLKNPIEIYGYNGYWNFCKVSASFSGVAIFSKYSPISIHEQLNASQLNKQSRVLTLQFQQFWLVAAYSPNAGKNFQRLNFKISTFEPALYEYCNRLKKKSKGLILCGDLNTAVHFKDTLYSRFTDKSPGFTEVQRKNLRRFLLDGWVDTYRKLSPEGEKYSWWNIKIDGYQKRIGKRFDYFIVSEDLERAVLESDVLEDMISVENSPILMRINLALKKQEEQNVNFSQIHQEKSTQKEHHLQLPQQQQKKQQTIQEKAPQQLPFQKEI